MGSLPFGPSLLLFHHTYLCSILWLYPFIDIMALPAYQDAAFLFVSAFLACSYVSRAHDRRAILSLRPAPLGRSINV